MRKVVYGLLGFNGAIFLAALVLFAFALVSYHPWVAAQTATTTTATVTSPETSVGTGLGLIGVAMATLGSTIGSGWALAHVGAAALGAVTEKPEMFGRTLVYVGLAEGIAIYGIIISIMILEKL